MDSAKLKELVISPENVEEKDFPELLALLSKYPYFQAANILAAKAKNSSELIKSAAVRTAYRSVLRQIISGEFDQDVSLHNIDGLDIQSGINAFEKLAKEEDEPWVESLVSSNEVESNLDQPAIENDSIEEIENLELEFQDEATMAEEKEEIVKNDLDDFKYTNFESEEELSTMSFEAPNYQFDLDSESSTTSLDDEVLENEPLIKEDKIIEEKVDENHFDPEVDLPFNEENENLAPLIDNTEQELEDSLNEGEDIEKSQQETFVVEDIMNEPDIDAEVKDLIEDDSFRNDLMESLNDLQNTRKAIAEEEILQQQKIEEEKIVESTTDETQEEEIMSENENHLAEKSELENTILNEEVFDSEYKEVFKNNTELEEPENMDKETPAVDSFNSENLTEEVFETEEENDTYADADLFDLNYLLGVDEQSWKEKKKMTVETTERQKEIIDKFIEEVPQISIKGTDERTQSELAKELYNRSVSEDMSIMTERMAILFSQQGKNGKAIEIYEQLILKYPEKKTYFAKVIENLRNE